MGRRAGRPQGTYPEDIDLWKLRGKRLRILRNLWGKSQEGLGRWKRWKDTVNPGPDHDPAKEFKPTNKRTISAYENGRSPLSDEFLRKVATCFGIDFSLFNDGVDLATFEREAEEAKKRFDIGKLSAPENIEENQPRQVNKIICLVKAFTDDNTPVLLTYFSPDWQMDLFINITLPNTQEEDQRAIKKKLADRLNIAESSISARFNRFDRRLHTNRIKQTADKQKAAQYGELAQYNFYYALVQIKKPPESILVSSFTCKDYIYNWKSLPALKMRQAIQEHNSDILQFLSGTFDATLQDLPASFEEVVAESSD